MKCRAGSLVFGVLVVGLLGLGTGDFVTVTHAGRNACGALVVHTDDSVVYYTTGTDYCASAMPATCAELNPTATGGVGREQMIWFVAAFDPNANPGVAAIQFGIRHNLPQGSFSGYGLCRFTIELHDSGWPENYTGNLVGTSGYGVEENVFQFYWFAVFVGGSNKYFGTTVYPGDGRAVFVDDGSPAMEDEVEHFGTVRFGGAVGENSCPGPAPGACCQPDGTCTVTAEVDCQSLGVWWGICSVCEPNPCFEGACCYPNGLCSIRAEVDCATSGIWQGTGTNCNPNPCPPAGACCWPDGTCTIVTEVYCASPGTWQGEGTICDPNPCPPAGACCQSDGICTLMTEASCKSPNIWQGTDTDCDPNPCFVGACCHLTYCDRMSEPQCVGYGGVFMGNGTLCDPNPCVSGVEDEAQITSLHLAATPNPSTRQVMIRYSLPKPTAVTIEVFNAAGALVRRIDEGMRQAGQHSVSWDGRNGNGDALPSGVYVARMLTLEGTTTGRVVLAR